MKSVYLIAIVVIISKVDVHCGSSTHEGEIILSVSRRTYSDLYHPVDSPHMRCEELETFMIEERRCVKNENVFKGESNSYRFKLSHVRSYILTFKNSILCHCTQLCKSKTYTSIIIEIRDYLKHISILSRQEISP
jgi:hypothetical protein